jgi:regulator of nonsense transcripts 1
MSASADYQATGELERTVGGPRRRKHDDDDEGPDNSEDDDLESTTSAHADNPRFPGNLEEEKELAPHACA